MCLQVCVDSLKCFILVLMVCELLWICVDGMFDLFQVCVNGVSDLFQACCDGV